MSENRIVATTPDVPHTIQVPVPSDPFTGQLRNVPIQDFSNTSVAPTPDTICVMRGLCLAQTPQYLLIFDGTAFAIIRHGRNFLPPLFKLGVVVHFGNGTTFSTPSGRFSPCIALGPSTEGTRLKHLRMEDNSQTCAAFFCDDLTSSDQEIVALNVFVQASNRAAVPGEINFLATTSCLHTVSITVTSDIQFTPNAFYFLMNIRRRCVLQSKITYYTGSKDNGTILFPSFLPFTIPEGHINKRVDLPPVVLLTHLPNAFSNHTSGTSVTMFSFNDAIIDERAFTQLNTKQVKYQKIKFHLSNGGAVKWLTIFSPAQEIPLGVQKFSALYVKANVFNGTENFQTCEQSEITFSSTSTNVGHGVTSPHRTFTQQPTFVEDEGEDL